MRRRTPKSFTVLIAPPGQSTYSLTIHPLPFFTVLSVLLVAPIVWVGSTVYSLHQKNQSLRQENRELNETAGEVIHELETLDEQIQDLRERAGIAERETLGNSSEGDRASQNFRGGLSVEVGTDELFQLAKLQLPHLSSQLNHQVKPALDQTLDEEAARAAATPKGLPVKDELRISSRFGLRSNPFGRGYEFHNGIDFPGPIGTPIYATATGVVQKAEWSRGYGYHVIVDHGYGYRTLYAHLSEVSVSQGDQVVQGHLVGYLGNTGRSTGPHLHYSVYQGETAVDPIDYLDDF